MKTGKFNVEGYRDPTPYYAALEIERRNKSGRGQNPKIYICSPFRGDSEKNVNNAVRYCRFALENGKFPIAPHLFLPKFMDDDDPAERKLALSFGIRLLRGCRELWVFGERISSGMASEIAAAKKRGIRIRQFTTEMEEIK